MKDKVYVAIDLKSFYASVECIDRGMDPMHTNLVVADLSRTTKTICLAVSPSLKAYGIPGRPRLFEVVRQVEEINRERKAHAPGKTLTGSSVYDGVLHSCPWMALDYVVAPPRMAHYMEVSTKIYQIYLKYVAPEDIHVYSIDEVFIDATTYLDFYHKSAYDFTQMLIHDVLDTTGITATAGIGSNLYLAKVAMDIVAKHSPADEHGVRVARLDERSYREQLWDHRPLTDFWRVGPGYRRKLEAHGMFTMGDVARCSLGGDNEIMNERLLYKLFGVNAQLLIDHAWGWEPCTIREIKAYVPESNSAGVGQVLQEPYPFAKARLIVREMADGLAMDLTDKGLVTDQVVVTVGYDVENLLDPVRAEKYTGTVTVDHYGRKVPKHAHGSHNLGGFTASAKQIAQAAVEVFERVSHPDLLVRRLTVVAGRVLREEEAARRVETSGEQISLFDPSDEEKEKQRQAEEKQRSMQEALLRIQKKYGKNAVVKGMNLEEGATAMERNKQIGGHRAE